MQISEDVSLKQYSTMRLGGNAKYLAKVQNEDDLMQAIAFADEHSLETIMIGYGSNIIWRDQGFNGLVIVNDIKGINVRQDGDSAIWTIATGVEWDEAVEKTVKEGYTGLEFLSLIPGTVGGTPVQNVGAYGQEIKNVFISLDAYDRQTKKMVTIEGKDCEFGYRTSRFKTTDRGRFYITNIRLRLKKENPQPPFYDSLTRYFAEHNITTFTPQVVRDAVIAVRTQKLPDPDVVANNGSFFANPIIDEAQFTKLQTENPDLPHWEQTDGRVKISAAWLVEHAGFKDHHDEQTGMATWNKQALVLINEHAGSTADLLEFKAKIIKAVQEKFDITLEQEPELIP